MGNILAYPLTAIYYLAFGSCLLFFHAMQWLCFYGLRYAAHKKSVDLLNGTLLLCLGILGTRVRFDQPHQLNRDQPYIIVCNHQSLYDIPPLIWFLRKIHPKFISKKELGKGIPSVSFNLRHGGSVLIDRKKPKEALAAIEEFSKSLKKTKNSTIIFPEGTRSNSATPKRFQQGGLTTLFENLPEAMVLPVSISHSWKLMRWGNFPMGVGVHMKYKVHQPIPIQGTVPSELVVLVEQQVVGGVEP